MGLFPASTPTIKFYSSQICANILCLCIYVYIFKFYLLSAPKKYTFSFKGLHKNSNLLRMSHHSLTAKVTNLYPIRCQQFWQLFITWTVASNRGGGGGGGGAFNANRVSHFSLNLVGTLFATRSIQRLTLWHGCRNAYRSLCRVDVKTVGCKWRIKPLDKLS
jgi:hypothetical protein